MTKILITMLIVFSVVFSTACPAKTIEQAKKSSSKLATYANAGVNITRDLYREQVINLATKDKIADAFVLLSKAGVAFDLAVQKAETAYGANPPRAAVDALFATFDSEVVGQFLVVLQALKLVNDIGVYAAVIESLKTAVLLVAKAFNRVPQIEARFA